MQKLPCAVPCLSSRKLGLLALPAQNRTEKLGSVEDVLCKTTLCSLLRAVFRDAG